MRESVEDDENEIVALRRSHLQELREKGQPFPNDFRRAHLATELHEGHSESTKESLQESAVPATVAGRVVLRRLMGKASFLTLQDVSGRIQLYVRQDELGDEAYEEFKRWDLGDIVGAIGTLMRTNKGELSIAVKEIRLLSKSIRPLPEKHKGLTDTETRYRQRYLDLIVNEESRNVFIRRAQVVDGIRRFFIDRDFMEVETPMMQVTPGGATAAPFVTHYNALDVDMYLRVAPELNLKRLVVGGFEQVFEINRNFRNEGMSTKHSPEFTMLEFYWAYHDYNDLMDLTEVLLRELAQSVLGTTSFTFQGKDIDLGKPIKRLTLSEAILEFNPHIDAAELEDAESLAALADKSGVDVESNWGAGKLLMELFEALVEDKIEQPLFVTQHPAEVSPLARRNDDDPDVTDRFELFVMGKEIANGFSELNDAEDQAVRFREQAAARESGDDEAMYYDEDYVTALEHGLPPTAGEGIGIDRLVMMLTDSPSIRDVVLFPHMKPKSTDG
ncbi:MAG TPA: lysine--tRNA ligase [Gammaproteobacteria bacterium]|nr:lysine--tRNA ligase [Gammaproteobacteria bacterium]